MKRQFMKDLWDGYKTVWLALTDDLVAGKIFLRPKSHHRS
jgi:hypothetical protein